MIATNVGADAHTHTHSYSAKHLCDSLIQPVVVQLRCVAVTRVTIDGTGVLDLSPANWRFFLEQIFSPSQKITKLVLQNVQLDSLSAALAAGIADGASEKSLW